MNITQQNRFIIDINYKYILAIAYLFIALPIITFILGWLKPAYGIAFSAILIIGLLFVLKSFWRNDIHIQIPLSVLLLIIFSAFFWVYSSGVGGFYPQKADWNWRNAILRDLIDYTWPVVYPLTGEGLVYYLSYFLIPALAGKLFGWTAANLVLFLWTVIGVCICFLLLCQHFQIRNLKKMFAVIIIFMVWREFDDIRYAVRDIFQAYWNYEYTNNNALLEWVTNQTIVPWVATLLFLDNRNIKNYAFLGLCVFASAPLPFVGLFIFLAADGLYQIRSKYTTIKSWLMDVFSIQNILAICSIFLVFALYFSANMAANGDSGRGGIGLYVNSSSLIALGLFWFFNALIFIILIYKEHRKDFLFWVMTVSLLIIPMIKVGEGRDFCMRASIPAVLMLMIYVMDYLFSHYKKTISIQWMVLLGAMGIFLNDFCIDWFHKTTTVVRAQTRDDYQAEAVHTLANKLPYGQAFGSYLNMYLTDGPYDTIFYSVFCKAKSTNDIEKDSLITNAYLDKKGFPLVSGYYSIAPIEEPDMPIQHGTMLSNTTIGNKYEIYLTDIGKRLVINDGENEKIADIAGNDTKWGTNNTPENQLFNIEPCGDYYKILWNNEYALTFRDFDLIWEPITENEDQLWIIKP